MERRFLDMVKLRRREIGWQARLLFDHDRSGRSVSSELDRVAGTQLRRLLDRVSVYQCSVQTLIVGKEKPSGSRFNKGVLL